MSKKHPLPKRCQVNFICGSKGKKFLIKRNFAQYWYWVEDDSLKFELIPILPYGGIDISNPPAPTAQMCCGACMQAIQDNH